MMVKGQIRIVFYIFFLFWGIKSFAQRELDSIITITTNKIFEEPNKVIIVANEVFAKATTPQTKIKALMLISNAYLSKRENAKSLEYALKSREYLDEISSIRTRMNVLNTIAMQHQQLRIYDKSIEYLDEAFALSKKSENADSISAPLGYNYIIRGFIYREQMGCEIALNYFNKAIYQYEKSPTDVIIANLSTLTYNKANCFLQISQIDSARVNFNKSIAYAQSVGANSLFAFAKKGLSEVFTVEGNYKQAILELQQAINASDNVGDLILNQGIYKNLSDNYLAINDRENYKLYSDKYHFYQKKIREKEQKTINASINNLIEESNYATDKALSNLNIVKWILIILIVTSTLLLVRIALNSHKKYKKAKEKLETFKI